MYKFKFISVLILASVLFGACSSDDSTETQTTEPAEVPVTFTVTTLTVDDHPMNTRATTRTASTTSGSNIQDVINEIHYYIYSEYSLSKEGVIKFDPKTETAPEKFGTFEVNMSPGLYSIYVFAGGKGDGTIAFPDMTTMRDNLSVSYKNKELFYYIGNFTVGNSATEHDITVSRRCAALRININEPIPENVGTVKYKITDYPDWYFQTTKSSEMETYIYQASTTDNKLDLFDYYFMAFPNNKSTEARDFTFLIYDKTDNLLFEKNLELTITKNRRTVISGNLFSSMNADGLTITVDDTWGDDISVVLE